MQQQNSRFNIVYTVGSEYENFQNYIIEGTASFQLPRDPHSPSPQLKLSSASAPLLFAKTFAGDGRMNSNINKHLYNYGVIF